LQQVAAIPTPSAGRRCAPTRQGWLPWGRSDKVGRMRMRDIAERTIRRAADNVGIELPQPGIVRRAEIARHLPPAPVVVEAGAHAGTDTAGMARSWSDATIYALEPVPDVYARLEARTRAFANVHTEQVALADRTGQMTMHISSGGSDGSSSLLPPVDHLVHHPEVQFASTILVPTVTLDDWADQHSLARVDFLWLDAQGAELSILKAGAGVLRNVRAIYMEVSLTETYAGVPLYPEVKVWMAEQGFFARLERLPWDDMGNVLFVRD
jgi:FkbM family methyltransferase